MSGRPTGRRWLIEMGGRMFGRAARREAIEREAIEAGEFEARMRSLDEDIAAAAARMMAGS